MIETLQNNLEQIRQRMSDAARKSGRGVESVKLVGVTKYVDALTTRKLFEAGCTELGESRPQSLWDKAEQLEDVPVVWHMIGHLQRNKVKRTIACADLIHSVDSLRLIDTIENAALEPVRVLLEVNVSEESAKHGFRSNEIEEALAHVSGLKNVVVEGLMCMAGLAGSLDDARREFESLRLLRDKHQGLDAANVNLSELSMGMSGDYEVAIEEGATIVRIGSSLFEGIR